MKIVTLASRIVLGLLFVVFGLNGFVHFIPQPVPPPGLARDYFAVMLSSHYLVLPFALQFGSGALLLINRYIPLALALLAPVIVNILMFHVLMLPAQIGPGLLAAIL
jgi:putative oxidoreductase